MKKQVVLIALSLFISLYIYLFYRTDRTLINQLAIYLISPHTYSSLKASVAGAIPLNDLIVYSLPEGLWVFCITLTSAHYYIQVPSGRLDGMYVPPIFSVGLELFQLLNITNGRFDLMDISISLICWGFGIYLSGGKHQKQNILAHLNLKTTVCLGIYGIVYFAHVFK